MERQQGLLGRQDCMVGVMVGLDRMVGVVEELDHMAVVGVVAIEHMVVGVVELGRMVLVLAVEVLATRLEQRVRLVSMERKQLGAGHCSDYTLPARLQRQLVPVQNMVVVVAIHRMAAVVVAVHIAAQVHCALSNGREQKKDQTKC